MRQVTIDEVNAITDKVIRGLKQKAELAGAKFADIDYLDVAREVNKELGGDWVLVIPPCPQCGGAGTTTDLFSDNRYRCTVCHYEYGEIKRGAGV